MARATPTKIGKYKLLDCIAVGGMAELYRGLIHGDHGFSKLIAIKRLLPHMADENNVVTSFIDEARLAALLNHKNIVQIYDFGSMDGNYFIAMEYLFGKDLHALIRKSRELGRKPGIENSLFIISQVCEGLEYAHKLKDLQGNPLNIIHRDVSPQNIFINYGGEVKIIDFGIAKASTQSTKTQPDAIKGKIAYMSPEQAEGRPIDHRSDIYATGILLYELLTGTRLFNGDAIEIFSQVREAQFEPPENIVTNLPPELYMIMHRALAMDPEQRYQTNAEMYVDIESCIQKYSLRQTSQGLALFMRELYTDDIVTEELQIREVTRSDSDVETARPGKAIRKARKTLVLKPKRATFADLPLWKKCFATGALLCSISCFFLLFITHARPLNDIEMIPSKSSHIVRMKLPRLSHDLSGAEWKVFEAGLFALNEKRFGDATVLMSGLLGENNPSRMNLAGHYERVLVDMASEKIETEPQEAKRLLLKAVEINPLSVQGRFQLGLLHVKMKEYKKAIESYEKVVQLDPSFADSYFNLGYAYAMKKEFEKAEAMYRQVVELAPFYLDEAFFNLAMVQEKEGKLQECLLNLEQAIIVNPGNKIVKKNLIRLKNRLAKK